jgi:hypothetical protein
MQLARYKGFARRRAPGSVRAASEPEPRATESRQTRKTRRRLDGVQLAGDGHGRAASVAG